MHHPQTITIIGVSIAILGVMDRWILGKPVDKWIKLHLLTVAVVSLDDFKAFLPFARWTARLFVRLSGSIIIFQLEPVHAGSDVTTRTRTGTLSQYFALDSVFDKIKAILLFAFVIMLANRAVTVWLHPFHDRVLSSISPQIGHVYNEAEVEFSLLERVNRLAASQGVSAKALLSGRNVTEFVKQLPPERPRFYDPARYYQWRQQPYVISKYGTPGLESGRKAMLWMGTPIAVLFAFISWNITGLIASRIAMSDKVGLIITLWIADVASAILLTSIAIAASVLLLHMSGTAGIDSFWVSILMAFYVSGFVFLSTISHFALGLVGMTLAMAEICRRQLVRSVLNIDSSSNSVISSALLLVGCILTVIGFVKSVLG